MTITCALGFTACVFGLMDGVQDGACKETFGQSVCSGLGLGIFFCVGCLMILKIQGKLNMGMCEGDKE